MLRGLLVASVLVASLSSWVLASSPHTDLSVTATVLAVVSASEIDVRVTRSSISPTVCAGTVVRVVYHGLSTPSRFEPLYMEAFDLNWKLTVDHEVYFNVAEPAWDSEQRLHAYVYFDPSGYGMINAFLLASGLAAIDPQLALTEPHAEFFLKVSAAAAQSALGIWADPDESGSP